MTQTEERSDDRKGRTWNDIIDRELYFKEEVSYRTSLEISAFDSNDNDAYYDNLWAMIYDDDEPYRYKNRYYRGPKEENELFNKALHLVRDSITWTRKWSKAPAFLHSLRVSDHLFISWYSRDVRMAGLVHDMIEDGWYTTEKLLELWCSKKQLN